MSGVQEEMFKYHEANAQNRNKTQVEVIAQAAGDCDDGVVGSGEVTGKIYNTTRFVQQGDDLSRAERGSSQGRLDWEGENR